MSKTIEEIAKQYVWEKNLGYDDVNRFLKESLFQPTHHLEIIAERYAKSQTQELQEQNAELAKELAHVVKALKTVSSFGATTPIIEHAEGILTKHKHLNKKP